MLTHENWTENARFRPVYTHSHHILHLFYAGSFKNKRKNPKPDIFRNRIRQEIESSVSQCVVSQDQCPNLCTWYTDPRPRELNETHPLFYLWLRAQWSVLYKFICSFHKFSQSLVSQSITVILYAYILLDRDCHIWTLFFIKQTFNILQKETVDCPLPFS